MAHSTQGHRSRVTRIEGGNVVRDVMKQLSEAEVTGDTTLVRNLVSKLANRSLFPAKVFIFHEDSRPGYFGTWTKSSNVIRPRRPLGKDVVALDYGYDSGEEWEEEAGGDADDVDDGEEDDDSEDNDSEMDDWLVDDDEPGTLLENRSQSPMFADLPAPPKRKADDGEGKLSKKRKVVVPLVPYAKGPSWETTIGICDLQPFQCYQIRLLNGVFAISRELHLTVVKIRLSLWILLRLCQPMRRLQVAPPVVKLYLLSLSSQIVKQMSLHLKARL